MRFKTDTATSAGKEFHPAVALLATAGSARATKLVFVDQDHVAPTVRSAVANPIAIAFRKLEKKWKDETRHVSSPMDKYLHPSYARIIGLGRPAVQHILKSLMHRPDDWFYALRAITGENPVPTRAAGDLRAMTDAWLRWGKRRGFI